MPSCTRGLLPVYTQVHQRIRAAAQASVDMDRIWDEHSDWTVPEPAATEVARAGFTYGACVGPLARHFASAAGGKKKLFAMTGKQHAVAHLGLDSGVLHPKWDSCYVHEDFIMIMRMFVQSSNAGSKPHQASMKAVRQFTVAKHIAMTEQSRWYR